MPSDVFDRIFVSEELRDAVSDRAWLQALLDAERALAAAEARAGVIPAAAAVIPCGVLGGPVTAGLALLATAGLTAGVRLNRAVADE